MESEDKTTHDNIEKENNDDEAKSMVSEISDKEINIGGKELIISTKLLGDFQCQDNTHSHDQGHHQLHLQGNFQSRGPGPLKPRRRIMGMKNPADISDVPKAFFERPDMQGSPITMDREELAHFRSIVACFFNYKIDSYRDIARMMRDLNTIDEKYRDIILDDIDKRRTGIEKGVQVNCEFLNKVVSKYQDIFVWKLLQTGDKYLEPFFIEPKNISKMRSTLRQIKREWSKDGEEERNKSFLPLINALEEEWPLGAEGVKREDVHVLCPGSGLGRLPFDISSKGFSSQGNEFSYHMLLTSNYILNETHEKEVFSLMPNIHNFCNTIKEEDNFTAVKFPDVNPWDCIPKNVSFSMAAGEFLKVYGEDVEKWDAVVTCFFIDTAHNVLEYIEQISRMLKKGGLWINIGPLLYHYSDNPTELSIDLTWNQVKKIIKMTGFSFEDEHFVESTYCGDPTKLMHTVYKSIFFKVRKPN